MDVVPIGAQHLTEGTFTMSAHHTLVMTGASRGIGRLAAERILALDPTVHLVVVARGDGGKQLAVELAPASSGHSVTAVSADLGSLASVRAAASHVVSLVEGGDLPPLTGFIGNAGIQHTNASTQGTDGHEATFTVNVLANHVFIRTLQDTLEPRSRITITVSDTHFGDFRHNLGMVPGPVWKSPFDLATPATFDKPSSTAAGRTAYSTSKLAAIYLVHEYARRLPALEVVSYNPGFVPGTGLARNADPVSRFMMSRVMPLLALSPFATTQRAAGRRLADVALGRTEAPSGSYVDRTTVARSSEESYSPHREAELWSAVEQLTATSDSFDERERSDPSLSSGTPSSR